jgi:hypothetical protein
MEEDILEMRAEIAALSLSFTALVSFLDENMHPELATNLAALLSGLSEQTNEPRIAQALEDIADNLEG